MEREILKKATAFFPVVVLCRVLQVSRSGFYEWAKRKPSARDLRNAPLAAKVAQAHEKSRGTYGSPRVRMELRARWWVGSSLLG